MAIERYSEPEGSEDEPMGDDSSETTTIPLSMVRDGQDGDVVRLEIVSRDEDDGTAVVKYAEPKAEKEPGGIDKAVAEFEA